MLPFPTLYVKIAVAVILFAAGASGGWKIATWKCDAAKTAEVQRLQKEIAQQQEDHEKERQRWATASELVAMQLDSLDTQKDTLLAQVSGMKLTRTIQVVPNVQGNCESAVLSDGFGVQWNTTIQTIATSSTAERSD